MRLKRALLFGIPLFLFNLWFLSSLYIILAHRGGVPMPPWGFVEHPPDNPLSQNWKDPVYADAGTRALDLLREHKIAIRAPAISAAVAIDGRVVWAGAAGWADIATEAPVTPQTQFRIGSTSKPLTATGLARLVDAGTIELDTPISEYVRGLPNPEWTQITPRQLASHSAGLPHYSQNFDLYGMYVTLSLATRFEDVNEALYVFDGATLLFPPGTDFRYSTFNTVLLSAAMQGAAGKPFLEVMAEEVFDPLGLHSTMAEWQVEDQSRLATFYWNDDGASERVRSWRDVDLSHRLAGGGFVSTSSDLARLGTAWLDSTYIPAGTRETFWTSQALPGGAVNRQRYAVGWRVGEYDIADVGTLSTAHHGGESRGAQSWLMVLRDYNVVVAVNINARVDVFWDFAKVSLDVAREFLMVQSAAPISGD